MVFRSIYSELSKYVDELVGAPLVGAPTNSQGTMFK